MTIFEFADVIDKEIVVRYYPNQRGRFMARFDHCEITDGAILEGAYEDGKTPDEAINKYAIRISGKRLAFNAMTNNRQEYVAPHLDGKRF